MDRFRFIEHTADLKFLVFGNSLSDIFDNCSRAISSIISRDKKIIKRIKKNILLEEKDNIALLYSFIDHLIYLLDAENFVISSSKIKIIKNKLTGTLLGDNASNYQDLDQIKAATYSEMYISKKNNNWEAQVVVDV